MVAIACQRTGGGRRTRKSASGDSRSVSSSKSTLMAH
jgi:hypothetical protein